MTCSIDPLTKKNTSSLDSPCCAEAHKLLVYGGKLKGVAKMNEKLYAALDIYPDNFLNPYIPHNQIRHLPTPISHWLGYRSKTPKEPPILIQWLLTLFATVAGICVVGAVYTRAPGIKQWNPPPIVASLGASAVLDYNTIKSPLAQPRNNILGHTVAAIVGVAISKAFQNAPHFFMNFSWVAAAVACGAASVAMSLSNAVHPPGGATAILACTQSQIIAMGWTFPPVILVASLLMLGVALLMNNTLRQYPTFWWTPEDVGSKLPRKQKEKDAEADANGDDDGQEGQEMDEKQESASDKSLEHQFSNHIKYVEGVEEVMILPYKIQMPPHIQLSEGEIRMLHKLQDRIREAAEVN